MSAELECIATLNASSIPSSSAADGVEPTVWCVAWSHTGKRLASCGTDKIVRIWTEVDGAWQCTSLLSGAHTRTVRSVCFSPCGRFVASASFDATVVVWQQNSSDPLLYEPTTTLEGHENEVKGVAWSPSGRFLATCGRDKAVWVWEVDDDDEFDCCSVLTQHSQDVKAVVFHPEKDLLVSTSYDDTAVLYEYDEDDWVVAHNSPLQGHSSTVWDAAFGHGERLATTSADCTLRVWQRFMDSGKTQCRPIATLSGFHSEPIYSVDWCLKNDVIACTGGDSVVSLFRQSGADARGDSGAACAECYSNYELIASVRQAHGGSDVNCVRFNPSGELLATCGDDGTIKLWNVKGM